VTYTFNKAAAMVSAIQDNADRLGLTWGMRPATVTGYDWDTNTATAVYDGDEVGIAMVSLTGPLLAGFRVMAIQVPPSANFIISTLGIPDPGTLAIRLRVTGTQSIADAGSGSFIEFSQVEHDFFGGGFTSGTPDRYVPPIEGIWMFNGRVVFASNATSRRAALLNTNGTTAAPGTFGGQSLQAPATGTCQIQCMGATYFNGTTDYVGLRAIQNSGAPLLTATTDGGSVLEGYYVGPFLFRATA